MIKNNSWCKGLNWDVGAEITPEAMTELIKLAKQYHNYGYTSIVQGDNRFLLLLLILLFIAGIILIPSLPKSRS